MVPQKCSLNGCDRPFYARTWCVKHYMRWHKHGNPNIVKKIVGQPTLRFWRNVQKTEGCWWWTAAKDNYGYGNFKVNGKTTRATKYSLFLKTGQWPIGEVLHSCDSPPCVNPNHLREGTHAENMKEAVERNLLCRGSQKWNAKLTEADIPVIRELFAQNMGNTAIARKFNVSPSTIRQIRHGRAWTRF